MPSSTTTNTFSIVITSDDLGYSKPRNHGILTAFNYGLITQTSLMVNAPATAHGVEIAHNCAISCGLHLNLTEFNPLTCSEGMNHLTTGAEDNHQRYFLGKMGLRKVIEGIKSDAQSLERVMNAIQDEIKAQIYQFKYLMGSLPDAIDGHMHIQAVPEIATAMATVIRKVYGEEGKKVYVRIPCDLSFREIGIVPEDRRLFYEEILGKCEVVRDIFEGGGSVICVDGFVGLATMGRDLTAERFEKSLLDGCDFVMNNCVNSKGNSLVLEVMCHVGYPSPVPYPLPVEYPLDEFDLSNERLHELNFFCGCEARGAVETACVHIREKMSLCHVDGGADVAPKVKVCSFKEISK